LSLSALTQVLRNHPGEVQLLSHACVAVGNLAANHKGNQVGRAFSATHDARAHG
jgi:hypothetical protein